MRLKFFTSFFIFLFFFLDPSFGAYLPPGGNNNDVQYKNGVGYAGSDSFITNGTNVGISSVTPGQTLDVQGTVRMTGFNLSFSPVNGDVLTSDGSGNGTWTVSNYWFNTAAAGNVGISISKTVGIGTTSGIGAGINVMNGNVGIGTWAPADMFQVGINNSGGGLEIDSNGNVGLGTTLTTKSALSVISGNVGIGTWVPGAKFQVGNNTFVVNTSLGNIGIGTYNPQKRLEIAPAGNAVATLGLISTNGAGDKVSMGDNNTYIGGSGHDTAIFDYNASVSGAFELRTSNTADPDASGFTRLIITTSNVGIDTISPSGTLDVLGNAAVGSTIYAKTYSAPATGLIVQGNVGVGTWSPSALFQVGTYNSSSSGFEVDSNGNVGLGTTLTSTAALSVMDGNVGIGTLVPMDLFQASKFRGFEVDANGNVGMGTTKTSNAPLSIMSGDVGIGTWLPQASLDLTMKTDAVIIPSGTTSQEPSTPINGMIRYNSTLPWIEAYQNSGWKPVNGVVLLCNSGTASTAVTSNTETNLATCTIPAGEMGNNGHLGITVFFKYTGGANTKPSVVRLSTTSGDTSTGTAYFNATSVASATQYIAIVDIWNTNSASGQTGGLRSPSTSAITTSAINTANNAYINFNCSCTNNSTDTCQLVGYSVVLYVAM